MRELKIGLVGCGGIGAVHASSWAEVPGARLVAACDADPNRAAATGARPYADLEAMLEAEALDAVDLCTPPHLHAPAALAALDRGLAVLCEKPLARTPQEAREIVEAAEAARVPLMTAFCHRFHPPIEWLRGLLEEGRLGRILMFRNRFGTRFAGVEERWFSRREPAGGGALMDTSVHSIDLFRYLVGEVASVCAALATFSPAIREVEDSAALLLTADTGALGVVEASWMTPWSANVLELYGERGAAVVDYDTGEARYRLQGDAEWTRMEPDPGPDRFVRELRHFAAVVRGEETPRVTGRDGLRAVEVIHQAYEEAARRRR